MPLTLADMTQDPEFYKLSPEDQKSAFAHADPSFNQLSPGDQNKAIGTFKLKYLQSDAYKGLGEEKPTDWGQQAKEFGGTLATDALGIVPGLYQAVRHPIDTGKALIDAQVDQGKQAVDAFNQGDYLTAAGRAGASVLPLVGPMAAKAGEEIGSGEYGKGAAHTLELLGPSAAKALPKRVPVGPLIKNVNNPVEQTALDSLKGKVKMTPGQETGSVPLQRVEQGLENLPGGGKLAREFYQGQQEQLAGTAKSLARSVSPNSEGAAGAGRIVQDRLVDRISKIKSQATRFYDDIRQQAAKNQTTVQTGQTPVMGANGPLLGANGKPIMNPILTTFESPVDLVSVRSKLQPVYDDLAANLPDARKAYSPAWKALDNLMKSGAPQMSAMDFDQFLGAVKSIARDGKNPMLTSQSQRLAQEVISAGEQNLSKALLKAGPGVPAKLKAARGMVKAYYETGELAADLREEPAQLYRNLTSGGDSQIERLKTLRPYSQKALATVGRTYLEGMIEKATQEGGFGRAQGILADWNKLGPETKNLLFGPKTASDVENFMIAAKRLTKSTNPSGSAHSMAAFGSFGMLGKAFLETVSFQPLAAAKSVAYGVGFPNVMARVLFSPGGAKLMTQAISLPAKTPAGIAARANIIARLTEAQREQQAEAASEQPVQ